MASIPYRHTLWETQIFATNMNTAMETVIRRAGSVVLRSEHILKKQGKKDGGLVINQSRKGWKGCYDVVVIGGGIVGMATAKKLLDKNNSVTCAVVEKENKLACHQSSHNSGVIHAGIDYKPGTLKAKLCTEGMKQAYDYFDSKNIPYKKVGKLIVATCPEEIPLLNDLYLRGTNNNVPDLKMIEGEKIKDIEPACVVKLVYNGKEDLFS